MEVSDPYELKLFQMFQSCDTEHCGSLDAKALQRLCGQLELHDQGAVLINSLTGNTSGSARVSFEQFKEALLNFLGTELDGGSSPKAATKNMQLNVEDSIGTCIKERSLIICDEVETYIDSPPESSDREVSPKLVMGAKKYGRRSRPQTHTNGEFSLTDSENGDAVEEQNNCRNKPVQRSSSQTDIPAGRRRRPPALPGGNKLKRCSSLPAQRNVQKLTPQGGNNKSNSLLTSKTMQTQKQQQLNSSVESLDTPALLETLPANSIIDIWERAHITNGRGILLALGFDEDEVNLTQLNKVLEEELRGPEDESQASLLRASLALNTAELTGLRQTLRQLHAENVKLRADNRDANQRVAMLAVEIDERHASLEDSTKKEIRLLEQRHAGVVRDLTARMANDRENWTNLTARLEARLKTFEQEEIKLKTDLDLVRQENTELETEQQKLQKQITELLEQNIALNREIAELQEHAADNVEHCGAESERKTADDDMLRLLDKFAALQTENTQLRDKNDELVAEMENLNLELTRARAKCKKATAAPSVVPELDELTLEEADAQANGQTATKRRGDSPSKVHITEESPRLGKLRKCNNATGGSENSDTSGEWMALNSELQHSAATATALGTGSEEEVAELKRKIAELEEQLRKTRESSVGSTADERCKELESSLEQMQRAYEDCEDYWQTKLSEERQLFEKERQIYEDEQQESDKKFTELMEKVREYEEQYSKDGRLSPIEEKDTLEQQYADLETEAEELRENARQIFDEKCKEIETLQHEIEDLRLRLGESVEILTGACELNNEAVQQQQHATNAQSPASSPISYLWHQSTIQEPVKDYATMSSPRKQVVCNNLSTSETAIFSTTPVETSSPQSSSQSAVSPIQKPTGQSKMLQSEGGDVADCETSSTASGKSFESHSVASTHSVHRPQMPNAAKTTSSSQDNSCSSPSGIKEELKRLKFFEISLKEQIKDLSLQRDGLVMELQQLQEARPVLEKAYARTAHPSLIQRVNQLELKNRHLQNVIKQQQHYTQSLMQQSWRQHQVELTDMQGRLEAQGIMLTEQAQRLQNADVLVKDLYVENSHLTATVQRLEQQRVRANLMHQQRQGLNGLPGMP